MRKKIALTLLISLLSLSLGAAGPWPAPTDISGTWEFLFYLTKGTKPVIFVLKQQGEKVTGTCCEPEKRFTGTAQGDKVAFEPELSGEDETRKTNYIGVLETPTKMTGACKIIRDTDQVQLKWTATKLER